MFPHQDEDLCWLARSHLPAVFICVPMSPAHLRNCVLCSCRSAVASTCPTPDCKTPRRPDCSCRRLLPPRTVSCSRHKHLHTHTHRASKLRGHLAERHLATDKETACVTGVTSTHVHVSHLPPAVGARIINFTAFPHQRAVMAAHSVQQTF